MSNNANAMLRLSLPKNASICSHNCDFRKEKLKPTPSITNREKEKSKDFKENKENTRFHLNFANLNNSNSNNISIINVKKDQKNDISSTIKITNTLNPAKKSDLLFNTSINRFNGNISSRYATGIYNKTSYTNTNLTTNSSLYSFPKSNITKKIISCPRINDTKINESRFKNLIKNLSVNQSFSNISTSIEKSNPTSLSNVEKSNPTSLSNFLKKKQFTSKLLAPTKKTTQNRMMQNPITQRYNGQKSTNIVERLLASKTTKASSLASASDEFLSNTNKGSNFSKSFGSSDKSSDISINRLSNSNSRKHKQAQEVESSNFLKTEVYENCPEIIEEEESTVYYLNTDPDDRTSFVNNYTNSNNNNTNNHDNNIRITSMSAEKDLDEQLTDNDFKDDPNDNDSNSQLVFHDLQKNIKQIDIDPYVSLYEQNQLINKEYNNNFTTEEYRHLQKYLIKKNFSSSIITSFFDSEEIIGDCLINHNLTGRNRLRMIDWMIEVLNNYKCEDETFFIAVGIMDRFFKKTERELKAEDLHLIGVVSMFIASKYQDLVPLKMVVVEEKISHGKFSAREILKKEEEILTTIDYDITKPSSWDFICFFFEEIFMNNSNNHMIKNKTLKMYMKNNNKFDDEESKREEAKAEADKIELSKFDDNCIYTEAFTILVKNVLLYLGKMNCHDKYMLSDKPSQLAAGSIYVAMKICEHINHQTYLTSSFKNILKSISRTDDKEILLCSQKILYNAQNFEELFKGMENLKKVNFDSILSLKITK